MGYRKHLNKYFNPPQSAPIPGRNMVRNRAGGYVFKISPVDQLKRFLLIGTTGGTYYASEWEVTQENIENVRKLLDTDPRTALDLAEEYSTSGRIPRNETAILVLALGLSHDDLQVRKYAASKLGSIVRIPTHLFTLVEYLKAIKGSVGGRLIKRAINDWYLSKPLDQLVYHLLKYQSRKGWNHVDIWRLTHPKPEDERYDQLFGWFRNYIYGENERTKEKYLDHPLIRGFMLAREAEKEQDVIRAIEEYKLTWEFVPTQWLNKPRVLKTLLPNLPLTALVRFLNRLTAYEVVKPLSKEEEYIVSRLTDKKGIKKARIHPIQVLNAAKTYYRGEGMKGSLEWEPIPAIVEALDTMLELSFENYEAAGKRYCVALDVSGSMSWSTAYQNITCAEAGACMLLGMYRNEPKVYPMAFAHDFRPLKVTKRTSLYELLDRINDMNFGATDCALPILHCLKEGIEVDTFVVITDNETWYGEVHPARALKRYRKKINPDAKLVVVGMTATNYSIADPEDPGMLDIAGFDPAVPKLIAEFSKGISSPELDLSKKQTRTERESIEKTASPEDPSEEEGLDPGVLL